MLRISIPKGQTLDGIEGPFVFVADSYTLDGVSQESGEWIITPAGPQRMSEWTCEESMIVTPLAFSMAIVCLVQWVRRFMLWFVLLSPFSLASAATWRLDAQTGVTISWPSGLSGAQVQGWAVFPGLGTVESTSAPTVTATSGGKPSVVSVPMITRSANWYYVITDGSSGSFESKTKLKWLDPYEVGSTTEPQSNESGNWSGSTPTTEAGAPISDPSNPVVDPTGRQKANGTFSNPFPHPATPILKVTPAGGGVPKDYKFPTLQPGQSLPWAHEQPGGFTYEIGWDIGDGVTVYPVGAGNSGTSAPVAGGATGGTPTSTSGPRTTPSLTSPADAPAGDVKAAVDRHAGMTQAYGEAARTAAGITNNNLDKLKDLFGQAVSKLESIDSKTGTGTGTGMDGVTIEGEALEHLASIDAGVNRTIDAPSTTEPPSADVSEWLSKAQTVQVQRIKDSIESIGNSMGFAKQGLGLGANYSAVPLVSSFTVMGNVYSFNLEAYGAYFDLFYYVVLGLWSLSFVWRFLSIVRGVFI